jgi:DNA polymerase sigma
MAMESLRSSEGDCSGAPQTRGGSNAEDLCLVNEAVKNEFSTNLNDLTRRNGVHNAVERLEKEQQIADEVKALTGQLSQVLVRDDRRAQRGFPRNGSVGRITPTGTGVDAVRHKTPERTTLERLRRKRIEVLERGAALRNTLTYADSWNVSAEYLQRQVRRFHDIVAESSYSDWMAEYERRARLARHLRKVASSRFRGCRVDVYGSTATGVLLKGGDLDVNFVAPMAPLEVLRAEHQDEEYSLDDFRRDVVGDLGRLLRRRRHEFANVQIITQTRVPLVKFYDLRSDIEVDVQVNNDFVVRNTALLRAYVRLDPRVRPLAIFIKRWAVARDLNEPFAGTLSSYSYLMLLIQYLQLVSPPILPCLQALRVERLTLASADGTASVEKLVECPQPDEIPDETQVNDYFLDRTDIQMPVRNEMSVTLLLAGFFYFYGYQFNYDDMVVSVRCGRLISKRKRGWDRDDRANQDTPKSDDATDGIGEPYAQPSDDDMDGHVDDDNDDDEEEEEEGRESGGVGDGSDDPTKHEKSVREAQNVDHVVPPGREVLNDGCCEKSTSSQVNCEPQAPQTASKATMTRDEIAAVSHRGRERIRLQRQRRQRERVAHTLQRHFFSIEDPFDMTHDLGRVCSEDSMRLLQHEFRRAFAILAQQLPLDALLQSYIHSEKPSSEKA